MNRQKKGYGSMKNKQNHFVKKWKPDLYCKICGESIKKGTMCGSCYRFIKMHKLKEKAE